MEIVYKNRKLSRLLTNDAFKTKFPNSVINSARSKLKYIANAEDIRSETVA